MNKKFQKYYEKKNENNEKEYFVYACGEWVPVQKEVYSLLTTTDRRQRYHKEKAISLGSISLEALYENALDDDKKAKMPICLQAPSAEDEFIKEESAKIAKQQYNTALRTLSKYPVQERFIIWSTLIKGYSEKTTADRLGISKSSLHRKKEAILKKLYSECFGGDAE